jgi:hypothetical protein
VVSGAVHHRGPVEEVVGVGGERELYRRGQAGGTVLGGGVRTQPVTRGVELLGAAGGLLAQPVERLPGPVRLLGGGVVPLGGLLRLVVEGVHPLADLRQARLRIGVGGAIDGDGRDGPGDGEGRGYGTEGRGAGAPAFQLSVLRHGPGR